MDVAGRADASSNESGYDSDGEKRKNKEISGVSNVQDIDGDSGVTEGSVDSNSCHDSESSTGTTNMKHEDSYAEQGVTFKVFPKFLPAEI